MNRVENAATVVGTPSRSLSQEVAVLQETRHAQAVARCAKCESAPRMCAPLDSGGWCLTRNARTSRIALPRGQSYWLPEGHVKPDSVITSVLLQMVARSEARARKCRVINDLGAGVGQLGRTILSLLPRGGSQLYTGYDGAGNVENHTSGFVHWADLTQPLSTLPAAEWVVSLEVGEHIPQQYESAYLGNLHALNCRGIVVSWAENRKGGFHHVNPRSPGFVPEHFASMGYRVNDELTRLMRGTTLKGTPGVHVNISLVRELNRLHAVGVSHSYSWFRAGNVFVLERINPRPEECTCETAQPSTSKS